jgi:hypothetical protein
LDWAVRQGGSPHRQTRNSGHRLTKMTKKPPQDENAPADANVFEIIGCDQLAARLAVPVTWVRDQVRSRAVDPIPCLRFGRYVRFRWNGPELLQWLARRRSG